MKPSICLGTAQFGLDYGVTNTIGKLSMDCIEGILYKAQTEKINFSEKFEKISRTYFSSAVSAN